MSRPRHDSLRIDDATWAIVAPLIPPPPPHPLGCCRRRIPSRRTLDGIFWVFRHGLRWADLDDSGICSAPAAYRRFRELDAAGSFAAMRALGLPALDELAGRDWTGPPRRVTRTSG